jgi:hypothetical protein
MIQLTQSEKKWIKLAKGHYEVEYPYKGCWLETAKPLFEEVYGWSPDEFHNDYVIGLFSKLMELHLKIEDDRSGNNVQLFGIFGAAFAKSLRRTEDEPIERAISELFGLIQNNTVIENGEARYSLDF